MCEKLVVAIAWLQVTNLMASPNSLMHPRIALRVLLGNILNGLFIDAINRYW